LWNQFATGYAGNRSDGNLLFDPGCGGAHLRKKETQHPLRRSLKNSTKLFDQHPANQSPALSAHQPHEPDHKGQAENNEKGSQNSHLPLLIGQPLLLPMPMAMNVPGLHSAMI
jgi:hypothetical protein